MTEASADGALPHTSVPDVALFSYGTLRVPAVQLDTFGRLLAGEPDVLPGFTTDYLEIEDARGAGRGGRGVQPVVRRTGNRLDKVVGVVLWVTDAELEAADEYEVEQFNRVSATLGSGRTAWVYVAR